MTADKALGGARQDRTGQAAQLSTATCAAWFVLLLVVGLVLRWPGLDWGAGLVGNHVEYVQLHPDEPRFVEIARGLHEGTPFRRSYVLGLGNALRLGLQVAERCGYEVTDARLVRWARYISLLSGMGLIVVVYLLGRFLTGRMETALFAASLVSVNTWCVTQSTYGTADMTYTFLLYLFALLAATGWSRASVPWLSAAAVSAGAAMSMKFGVVLLPSCLLCGWAMKRNRLLWGGLFVVLALFAFLATQGGAFNLESMRAIRASFVADNAGGFAHNKWLNPMVYTVQCLRMVGFPAAILLVLWLAQRARRRWRTSALEAVVFLPIILHGLGIQFINLPFPRHMLPLLPLVLLGVAMGLKTRRRGHMVAGLATLCWSAVLATTDGQALRRDARGMVMEWMAFNVKQDVTVWADPYFKVPVTSFYPAASASQAGLLLLHEGWTFRFERSELNPLREPGPGQLYHAHPSELEWNQALSAALARGEAVIAYEAGPSRLMPEQILYDRLWGSLNKFAGRCRVIRPGVGGS